MAEFGTIFEFADCDGFVVGWSDLFGWLGGEAGELKGGVDWVECAKRGGESANGFRINRVCLERRK